LVSAIAARRRQAASKTKTLAAKGDNETFNRANPIRIRRSHSRHSNVGSILPSHSTTTVLFQEGQEYMIESPFAAHRVVHGADRVQLEPLATRKEVIARDFVQEYADPVHEEAAADAVADEAAAEDPSVSDAKARARVALDNGELPPGWDWETADNGDIYFTQADGEATWTDPRNDWETFWPLFVVAEEKRKQRRRKKRSKAVKEQPVGDEHAAASAAAAAAAEAAAADEEQSTAAEERPSRRRSRTKKTEDVVAEVAVLPEPSSRRSRKKKSSLPEGWEARMSDEGETYYEHVESGEVTWERPQSAH
jgi:hypothetical protein